MRNLHRLRQARRAMGALGMLLPSFCISLPARAETSAPFYAYFVAIGPPFGQPGGGGGVAQPEGRVRPHRTRARDDTNPSSIQGCYSDDGTIPDFAAPYVSSFPLSVLTSCSVGSSFSVPINLAAGSGSLTSTGSGMIEGSIASFSFNLNVAPFGSNPGTQTPVILQYIYVQVFDSPVPPGSQLTFSFTGMESIAFAGVEVLSDCDDPSCVASYGTLSPGGLQTITDTITIGPSGTYTVVAAAGTLITDPEESTVPVPAPPYSASFNLGCALQAIPTPSPGQVPAIGLPGNNWSFNYGIGDSDGLEVTNVNFGNRPMAAMMSVPYLNITTSDFSATHCQLEPDGDGDCASKLVYFQSGTNDVSATYVITNIPEGTSSCLAVTENFEFDPPAAGDKCEPSGNIGCARFYPTVQYQYLPDEDSKSVTEIDLPMRIQFTVGEPGSNLLPPNQGQYAAIGKDNNTTGLENFFNGNPVQKEVFIPNAIQSGAPGAADDYYQTYLKQIDSPGPGATGPQPDCPSCVQIHWRWPSMFAGFADDNGGEPLVPLGSTQSVDVAMVAYPDNTSKDCSNLASGQQLAGMPFVFWYCGKGNQDSDTFFQHGGFFNPLSASITTPAITVTRGGFRINHATGQWVETVTLTNNGSTPVTGPIALVLDSLSGNVTLANPDGVTGNAAPVGSPFVFAPLDNSAQLAAGQSLTLTLEFANPKNGAITYTTQVLAGGLP